MKIGSSRSHGLAGSRSLPGQADRARDQLSFCVVRNVELKSQPHTVRFIGPGHRPSTGNLRARFFRTGLFRGGILTGLTRSLEKVGQALVVRGNFAFERSTTEVDQFQIANFATKPNSLRSRSRLVRLYRVARSEPFVPLEQMKKR